MTVLAAIKRAATVLGIDVPGAVFSSADRALVELADVANEAAEQIARHHEWQTLKRLYAITGNGDTDAFPLPTDYDRMPKSQSVRSDRISGRELHHYADHDQWLRAQIDDFQGVIGSWTILGGEIVFRPVLGIGEVVRFYYLTNLIVMAEDGTTKTAFDADTDTFRLDERLLRLGIIWRWKAAKGLPYEEQMGDFELALSQRIGDDKGSRHIVIGRPRWPRDVEMAYPRSIIP